MGQKYQIKFYNKSLNSGNFCCFQKDVQVNVPNVLSLAWFTKYSNPDTQDSFDWTIDYDFVWGETGTVNSGINFSASQTVSADLTNINAISLDYNNAYRFIDQKKMTPTGNLFIHTDGNIPIKSQSTAYVGIGMSGSGTFVVAAQPNQEITFTPHPTYWLAFGNYTQGAVVDTQVMSESQQVVFPENVYTMYATLNNNNTWTISQVEPA